MVELKDVVNSPGLWMASSCMIIVILCQSLMFLKAAWTQADKLEMPKERRIAGIRSAMITAIGPSMSPVIILLALIAVMGAPTTWMRMNDIGAARTELAMITLATNVIGIDPQSADFNIRGFSYALWGMALNNFGWMFFTLILTHKMGDFVTKLNAKYDPLWIKYLISGATIGLFAFLLSPRLVTFQLGNWVAAGVSAFVMVFIAKAFPKQQRLQELALGIAMLCGMYITVAVL